MNRFLRIALVSAFVLMGRAILAVDKVPDKLPNGERPWPAVPDAEVQKIRAALPEKAHVAPQKPRKLLVFYRTDGYPHSAIPEWNTLLELLGEKTGAYQATLSQSYDDLQGERLKQFDAVFFNNTCGMRTPEPVKASLQHYIKSGRGFAGNHGAGDNWHDWPEGKQMIGVEFVCHPFGRIRVKVDDPQSPLTAVFGGKAFPFVDEMYAFKAPYSREKLRLLLSIDYPNSPDVIKAEENLKKRAAAANARPVDKLLASAVRDDHDYGIAWIRPWGQGRVFYCSFGHRNEVTWDPMIVRFFLAGIQYAMGDLKADDAPVATAK
jgi:type 1 glutamine amidotransferase